MQKLHTKNISGGKWFFAAVLSFLSVSAFAQISIPGMNYPVDGGDPSIKLLGYIFGGAIEAIPGNEGLMGAVMQVFNSAILAVSAIVAFYMVVQAIMGTAHDGEVLGKNFSSMWIPIRLALAVSLMVPASGGYSAVQMLVLSIATHGVGLANQVTTAGYKAVFDQEGFTRFKAPPILSSEGREIASSLLPIAVCMAANEKYINLAQLEKEIVAVSQTSTSALLSRGTTIRFGFKIGTDTDITKSCGSARVSSQWANAVNNEWAVENANRLSAAQLVAVTEMYREIKIAANAGLVVGASVDYGAALKTASANYDKNLTSQIHAVAKVAVAHSAADSKKGLDALIKKGWFGLGESYLVLAKIGATLPSIVQPMPVSVESSPVSVLIQESGGFFATFGGIISKANNATGAKNPDGGTVLDPTAAAAASDDDSIWNGIVDKILDAGLYGVDIFMSEPGANPILDMKARGDWLLTAASTIIGVSIAKAAGIGGAFLSGAVITGAITGAMMFITLFVTAITSMGMILAVYVPLIPYLIWTAVIIAWLIAVVEAVVAAPLWMLTHVSGDGDGIASGASQAGYKFVAAVFLRPTLSVISFFVASMIVLAVGDLVNTTFGQVIREVQSDSVTGLLTMFGFIGVYAGLCSMIVNKSFGLTLTMPSTILRWFGSTLNGDDGEGRETADSVTLIGGAAVSAGHGMTKKEPGGAAGDKGGKKKVESDTSAGAGNAAKETGGGASASAAPATDFKQ